MKLFSNRKNLNFDSEQIKQIQLGLESEVDITIYANPEFDFLQMEEILIPF